MKIKAIVTRANPDGSFDEVGMRNRTIVTSTSPLWIRKKALAFGEGKRVRVAFHHSDRFYAEPYATRFFE